VVHSQPILILLFQRRFYFALVSSIILFCLFYLSLLADQQQIN